MKRILWLGSIFLLGGCCTIFVTTTSEYTVYRGRVNQTDTTIEIYAEILKRGVFDKDGEVKAVFPQRPDSQGYFIIRGTTPSHDECESPDHWDNGPLEIYIRGPHIEDYHDTLSVAELKVLPRLKADSLGIKPQNNEIGIWQLPDIVLTPKE